MEFINYPQKLNLLRADCCSYLKGENGESISIKIKEKSYYNRRLLIKLALKSIKNQRHFFKLFRIDGKKNPKEEKSGEIEISINGNTEDLKLDFFGIRKTTKEQAMKFIREFFNDESIHEQIFKQNSSVAVLEIYLCDQENILHHLAQEIHVGNPSNEEIKVSSYTPKTLCGDGEVTFYLSNKIKDDNDHMQLIISNLHPKFVKKIMQPAKKVLVYKITLKEIFENRFEAQLCNGKYCSDFMEFKIRKPEPENIKRKISSDQEMYFDTESNRKILKSTTESNVVNVYSDKKRQVKDILTDKKLREIARVGHDFAFGKDVTDRMKKVMYELPVVCILQDDVGDTPLNNAILKNNEDRADALVDIIFNNFPREINLSNTSGHTALILSPACDVSVHFIQKLIDCGANLMAVDDDGNTALNIAIQYRKSDVFHLLVNAAISQNVFNEINVELMSLLKDVLNNEFFDGFRILANLFPIILDESFCENIHDINQLTYKDYVDNFKMLIEFHLLFDDQYFTPVVENNIIDDGLIFDSNFEDQLSRK